MIRTPDAAATQPGPGSSGRFAGLDGIRALAIAGVFVFHLSAAWLPGGFLGVDVFFVISGFLITSLLVRERAKTGRIDVRSFWVRRARRLLPALALCVGGSALVARAVSGDLVVGLPRQVLGAATFSTNWLEIAANQSYFDATAPTLFMNLWSLAVEEQFYLVWPLAAFALLAWAGPRLRLAVPAALALASTVLMAVLYLPEADATRLYYGTDTHLVGLMAGAALAFAWASGAHESLARLAAHGRPWAGPAALAGLVLLMAVLSEGSHLLYRGGFALASLLTGVLLVTAVARHDAEGNPLPTTLWQRVLDNRGATWVGERSYGLYLWHWPVILVIDQLLPTTPNTAAFAGRSVLAVAVTVSVAAASHRFVEAPVRREGFRATGRRLLSWLRGLPRPRFWSATALAVALVLCLFLTVATAPTESQTARILRENAAAAAGKPGGSAAPLNQTWTMPAGDEIDGFGDSIMVGCVPALNLYFPGLRLDAQSNRRWSDGVAAIAARGADTRRAVVLDFGMNGGVDTAVLTHALDMLGPDRMVVVVNLYGTFPRIDSDNATIQAAVQGRPNVVVADWYATVKANPDVLQADKKHPSLRGSHLYARTVQEAFAALVEVRTGARPELKQQPLPR